MAQRGGKKVRFRFLNIRFALGIAGKCLVDLIWLFSSAPLRTIPLTCYQSLTLKPFVQPSSNLRTSIQNPCIIRKLNLPAPSTTRTSVVGDTIPRHQTL